MLVIVILAAIALLASFIPARRAPKWNRWSRCAMNEEAKDLSYIRFLNYEITKLPDYQFACALNALFKFRGR
jgi:hypothetical protein